MNAAEILAIIGQAVAILPTLVTAGINIADRVATIKDLADSAAAGTTTDAQIAAVRAQLDADLNEFNAPLD